MEGKNGENKGEIERKIEKEGNSRESERDGGGKERETERKGEMWEEGER